MKIPTLLAEGSLSGTPQSAAARPLPSGLDDFSQGLAHAGANLSNAGEIGINLEKRKKAQSDARWVNDSFFQEMKHLTDWQSNPENNSKEDYAQAFMGYAEERIKTYEASAPSPEAKNAIKSRLQSAVLGRYEGAVAMAERTRLENTQQSIISQTALAVDMFRMTGDADELHGNMQDIIGATDESFPGMPKASSKMKAYVQGEVALGLAPTDKDAAEKLVRESSLISEDDKPGLLYKINTLAQAGQAQLRDGAERVRKDHLAAVEMGNAKDKLPLKFYSAYPDPQKEKTEDDFKIDIFNKISEKISELAPLAPDAMQAKLAAFKKAAVNEQDKIVYTGLTHQLSKILQAQEEDPVSWLTEYNPEVKSLTTQLKSYEPGSAGYESGLTARNDAVLRYQGVPTPDAKNKEWHLYHGENDLKLLSKDTATEMSRYINSADPAEVVKRLSDVMAAYPDDRHKSIVFNNMVSLPGKDGIRQEFQLVWQNKDQWWIDTFINTLRDAKGFGSITPETKKDIDKEIDNNSTWTQFQHAMIGPGGERGNEVAGFKSGIAMYANYFLTHGDKTSAAVNKATDKLINSTLGITRVNGRPLIVSRMSTDKIQRSDEVISDIGRRLVVALHDLDPRMLSQKGFAAIASIHPDENNIGRLQALRDTITRSAFFNTSHDGNTVTLYVPGDDGIPFAVTDKKGNPLLIHLEDLPLYSNWSYTSGIDPTGAGESGLTIRPTYPIEETKGNFLGLGEVFGTKRVMTNWPVTGQFWKTK